MASWFDWAERGAFSLLPGTAGLPRRLEDVVGLAMDRTLRLAVTGLRQSGKTVFITLLAHHLLQPRELPFLAAVKEGRYLGARLLPQRAGDLAPFPFAAARAALAADPPAWPAPTTGLSMLRLAIRHGVTGLLQRQFGEHRTLTLEIIDYPGEWLLDLPMLQQSFEAWSAEALARAAGPGHAPHARAFLDHLAGLALDRPAPAELVAATVESFAAYLARGQTAGLSLLQPGRLAMPGDLAGSALVQLCPLPPGPAPAGSLRAAMAERYRRYCARVVEPFYRDHFSRFDRQVVLVDLIGSLNRGRASFDDTQAALQTVLKSFRYGAGGLLARLFRPRIDTLLFAATKADHVAHNQHHNLRLLLEQLVIEPARGARFEGVPPIFMALAALRSTDVVRTDHHGQQLSCVRGRLKGEDRETILFPGEIPPEPPAAADWQADRFRFRDFAPRRLQLHGDGPPQHIRLDQALQVLLGDRLQ
jgi:hypothetical protein